MKKSRLKIYYSRNIKLAVILSEVLILFAFLFAPQININSFDKDFSEPIILIDDVPVTYQTITKKLSAPKLPQILIDDQIEDIVLDNVIITEQISISEIENELRDDSQLNSTFSRIPRQLLEVLPDYEEPGIEGTVSLFLKIDSHGKVKEHKILQSTVSCDDCLNSVITAAYNSKWEPALINGRQTEYWIEKKYTFN